MATAFFNPVYSIVNAIVISHLQDEKLLAGFGLGAITVGVFALSISKGSCEALGTFVSHAYGQKEYRQCQVYRNKAILLSFLLFTLSLAPLIWIKSIFLALGEDAIVADHAATTVHLQMPFLYFYYLA